MARMTDPKFRGLFLPSREPESNLSMVPVSALVVVLEPSYTTRRTFFIALLTKAVKASQKARLSWLDMSKHEHGPE